MDYRGIYACLKDNDAERARRWMREHTPAAQERIRESFVAQTFA